jgi:hypothetical protein
MKYPISFFTILFAKVQLQAQIKFGGNVNYYQALSIQKTNATPLPIIKNVFGAGAEMSYALKKSSTRLKLELGYFTGNNSKGTFADWLVAYFHTFHSSN